MVTILENPALVRAPLPIASELIGLHASVRIYAERDILKLPIPRIPSAASKAIISHIRAAHQSRQEAQALLAKAKRAVEVAIEEGEEKALNLLSL